MSCVEQYVRADERGKSRPSCHMSYFVCCLLHGLTEKEEIYVCVRGGGGGGGGCRPHAGVGRVAFGHVLTSV